MLQGEFGIGLLSFWTVGDVLTMVSTGKSMVTQKLTMVKNNQGHKTEEVKALFSSTGTELTLSPLLPGIRQLSGEKIQNYLASELRDRISKTGVVIKIIDRTRRKEFVVEPRKFKGRLLHELPSVRNPYGEIYYELYMSEPSAENKIGLYKHGTRIIPDITTMDHFASFPWNSPYLEGIIDVSFLQLTPGTREGIIYDEALESFAESIEPVASGLETLIEEQKRAEEEKASRNILHKITKALHEAFNHLPQDEYSWLSVKREKKTAIVKREGFINNPAVSKTASSPVYVAEEVEGNRKQLEEELFYLSGPLESVVISPSSVVMGVSQEKKFKVIARDKKRRQLDGGYSVLWYTEEGEGEIDNPEKEFIVFTAPKEPGITLLSVMVQQHDTENECSGQAVITVTDSLDKLTSSGGDKGIGFHKGLPGYTFQKAPGELWRSRFDEQHSVIVINNAHADFIYASKVNMRKLKYITKLFTKELVLINFPEAAKEEMLERLVELQMYTEENLR